jgi:hypothetical protein
MIIGGGFDYHFSIRPIELGYVLTDLDELNNVRLSTGIVLHF